MRHVAEKRAETFGNPAYSAHYTKYALGPPPPDKEALRNTHRVTPISAQKSFRMVAEYPLRRNPLMVGMRGSSHPRTRPAFTSFSNLRFDKTYRVASMLAWMRPCASVGKPPVVPFPSSTRTSSNRGDSKEQRKRATDGHREALRLDGLTTPGSSQRLKKRISDTSTHERATSICRDDMSSRLMLLPLRPV